VGALVRLGHPCGDLVRSTGKVTHPTRQLSQKQGESVSFDLRVEIERSREVPVRGKRGEGTLVELVSQDVSAHTIGIGMCIVGLI
jgi:hypothetical protein